MLIHDSFNAIGVMLAQLRLLVFSSGWRYVGRCGSLAIYRRDQLGGGAWALNALRQLAGLPYFVRNLLVKVALTARAVRLLGCWAMATIRGRTDLADADLARGARRAGQRCASEGHLSVGTSHSASNAMCSEILLSPTIRSRNMIGTSTTRKPARSARKQARC